MNRKVTHYLAAGALSLVASVASADSQSANLGVSASVSNNCTISTVAVAFGPYDPIVTNKTTPLDDSTGTVTITCTQGTTATIALDEGANNASATGTTRALTDGSSNYLNYELYQDSSHTTVWNDTTNLLEPPAAPSSAARNFTVYGRIPAGQDVPEGTYNDTVVATVNF
ncbi:MAG: spore coat U domain-containing protein [Candidatus Binatia bacterium]